MSKRDSEQTTLLRRSILWLTLLLAVVGITYSYERSLFQDSWQALTASTATEELPIYRVQTDKPQVALTFDTAWGNEDITKILDTLKQHNIHATFFMTGQWVEKYPDDVKAIQKAGHDLGNHAENHKHMPLLDNDAMCDEINKVTEKVKKLTGTTMNLFRPPYGDYNNQLIIQAKNCGYYTVVWNVDSLDWKDYGANAIVDTILNHKELQSGSIILMHSGTKYTAEALPKVIEGLEEKGYEIVPVSKLIYKENFHMNRDGSQISDNHQETSTNSKESVTEKPQDSTTKRNNNGTTKRKN